MPIKQKIMNLIICVVAALFSLTLNAQSKGPIVLVSSYNPDVRNMRDNMEEFSNRYKQLGGTTDVDVISMNCKNMSESGEWKSRLASLLSPYYADGMSPTAIVLFGMEASTTFFSLDNPQFLSTPVAVGLRSDNIITLPEDSTTDICHWNPESKLLSQDFSSYNIIGGDLYKYDIEANLQLSHKLFPKCDTLVLLTDNTLGGISMKSYAKKILASHPEHYIESIDGRKMSFSEVNNMIGNLKGNRLILIGTWRIDKTDSYSLSNTTYSLGSINQSIPAITLSSVGLGHWALGGYIPNYHVQGGELADVVYGYETSGKKQQLKIIDSNYKFDYERMQLYHLSSSDLPKGSELLNAPVSIFEEYLGTIIFVLVIIATLLIGLFTALYYLRINKKLTAELKRHSAELELAKDKAEKANKMKSAFIANMSHEIRTPLNAVMGFAQIITDSNMRLSDEEREEYGKYIQTNSATLLNLVNDILDISKLDSGTLQYNITEVDLVNLCQVGTESAKAGLSPKVEIRTILPDSPVMANTDKLRLLQVINNLFTNAKKFTEEGSITIKLEIKAQSIAEISVSDTGTGIPTDKAETIFERFKQLDNFKQGTGLGLAISRSIVQQLDGKIWLDTSYTNGARFIFTQKIISR